MAGWPGFVVGVFISFTLTALIVVTIADGGNEARADKVAACVYSDYSRLEHCAKIYDPYLSAAMDRAKGQN